MNVITPVIITSYFIIFSCVVLQHFNEKTNLYEFNLPILLLYLICMFFKVKTLLVR